MKRFRKSITALFGFDRRERRGTFVLSLIVVILLLVRLTAMRPGDVPAELPPLPSAEDVAAGGSDRETAPPVLFIFDPNTCSYDDLLRLGLSARQARTLINYRSTGARFRRPDDLRRVYGIDSASAAKLIPYIFIEGDPEGRKSGGRKEWSGADQEGRKPGSSRGWPGAEQEGKKSGGRKEWPGADQGREASMASANGYRSDSQRRPSADQAETAEGVPQYNRGDNRAASTACGDEVALDINRCSAGELVAIPGIGPVLAERIIKYRNLLGGFVDKWQLAEVYGLDSSVARLAAERLTLTFDDVRPLVLDSASYSDLARHPYLGYEAARKITTYRMVSGLPVTLGEMVSSGVITSVQAGRIAPYVRPAPGVTGTDYEFISSKVLK